MRFSNTSILYLLVLVPVLYIVLLGIGKKRLNLRARLGYIKTLNKFSSKKLDRNFKLDSLYISLALLFFILALSGPQAGTRLEPLKITGSDIYIAIDLSSSMMAEDIKPNRFERAKIDAVDLVKSLQGDRAGLILFAGDAFVQCPLTTDYDALLTFINAIDSDESTGGTSLYTPLDVVLHSISPEEDKFSILLLLTDGENTGTVGDKVLKDLQQRGIKVFSVGIGTKEGAPIPIYEDGGRRIGYKKDTGGKVVISKLRDDLLKEIAEKTNGYYFEAGAGMSEIGKFLSTVNSMKKRELETKRYTMYEERFQFPLGIGLFFLLLSVLASVKTRRNMT